MGCCSERTRSLHTRPLPFSARTPCLYLSLSLSPHWQHAVGNTIKRVVIIVAACIAFRTPMTPLSIAGSTIAVGGTLLYSLVKAHYEKKK